MLGRERGASSLGSQHPPLAVLEPHLRQILKIIIKSHSNRVDVGICTGIPDAEVGQEKQVRVSFTEQKTTCRFLSDPAELTASSLAQQL